MAEESTDSATAVCTSPSEMGASRMSRQQILTLIAMATLNFSSMICYSILGPFFPFEAEKKGVSQAIIGLIFGCYAFCTLIGSLILGKYIVQIGAKFMITAGLFVSGGCTVLFGFLDRAPEGTVFIVLCFVIRSIDAVGFAAAVTASFAVSAKVFPHNISTILFIRKWMMVFGGMTTAVSFCFLGPVPLLHIESQLWLTVVMLVLIGFSLCMAGIPTFSEILVCAHDNGFEDGLSTLGLVSGLFSAVWSAGMFFGPTIGGVITQKLNFEWGAGVQGVLSFISAILLAIYFSKDEIQRRRLQKINGTQCISSPEEESPLLASLVTDLPA